MLPRSHWQRQIARLDPDEETGELARDTRKRYVVTPERWMDDYG